jgi:hypothetical protein
VVECSYRDRMLGRMQFNIGRIGDHGIESLDWDRPFGDALLFWVSLARVVLAQVVVFATAVLVMKATSLASCS